MIPSQILAEAVEEFLKYLLAGVLIVLVYFFIQLLFCLSIYKLLKRIPRDKLQFPAWLTWLMLIPVLGTVFRWVVIPFNVPNSLKRAAAGDLKVERKARNLFICGLLLVIIDPISLFCVALVLAGLFGEITFDQTKWLPYAFVYLINWIVYWVLVVRARVPAVERNG